MPDELPALEEMPDSVLQPSQTQHAAQWASRFGGGDTNLALRQRHNADIIRHVDAVQEQQKAHFMDELGRDKVKQDLYFRQKTLDSTIANRENALAQRQQQFDAKLAAQETVNKVRGELGVAQLDLAKTRAEAAANAAKVKMDLSAAEAADTTALTTKFLAQKAAGEFQYGTPGMADALLKLRAEHPNVGKNTFSALWAGTNQNFDPETYATKKAQAAANLEGTAARTAATVAGTAAIAEKAASKALSDDEKLHLAAQEMRNRIGVKGKPLTGDEIPKAAAADALINEIKSRIDNTRVLGSDRPASKSGEKFSNEHSTPAASKPLDAYTAKAFLQEAGGDKDKARELARKAGHQF